MRMMVIIRLATTVSTGRYTPLSGLLFPPPSPWPSLGLELGDLCPTHLGRQVRAFGFQGDDRSHLPMSRRTEMGSELGNHHIPGHLSIFLLSQTWRENCAVSRGRIIGTMSMPVTTGTCPVRGLAGNTFLPSRSLTAPWAGKQLP